MRLPAAPTGDAAKASGFDLFAEKAHGPIMPNGCSLRKAFRER
jgi:hypothetical protein